MNILIGLDGSQNGFEAIDFVGRLLNPTQDAIGLVHSYDTIAFSNRDVNESLVDRAQKAVAQVIFDEGLKHLATTARERAKTFTGSERPGTLLLNNAKEWPADLIVVGAKGLSTLKELLLGSVSNEVARSATQTVLVVRQPTDPKVTDQKIEALRVLVAHDSTNGDRVANIVNKFSFPTGSIGRVMAVIEPYYYTPLPKWLLNKARDADTEAMSKVWAQEHEQEKSAKQTELQSYIQKLPTVFQNQQPIVSEGNAAEQILETITRERIDLVIVGKQIYGVLDRLLLGSTAEKILRFAKCSVLMIPGE